EQHLADGASADVANDAAHRIEDTSGPATGGAGELAELALDEGDQAPADLPGLLLGGRLDHHPDQRLSAARAHEHAPPTRQRLLGGPNRGLDVLRMGESVTLAHAHVHEPLGELRHRVALAQVPAAEGLEGQQSAGDAIPGAVEAHLDDVPRLLTAEGPAAGAQLGEDVAVA